MALQAPQVSQAMNQMGMGGTNPISDLLFGKKPPTPQIRNESALNQLLSSGLSGLQNNPLSFEPIRQQALKTYEQNIIPSLAERFTTMGGGQRSSAFKGALGNSASDFLNKLAALEAQYNMGARQQSLRETQLGLSNPVYSILEQQRSPGILELLGPSLGSTLGSGLGPVGGLVGGGLGSLAGSGITELLRLISSLFGGG